ncbi:MAG: NAD(P)H-hydrate dehydratase [Bacteroidota bacterium]
MKILNAKQIREADAYTIQHEPITSSKLMERAAAACYDWISERFEKETVFHIACGTGNNGGDGLVIARKLSEAGYKTLTWILRCSDHESADFTLNLKRLKKIDSVKIKEIKHNKDLGLFPENIEGCVIVDALFGSGLTRPLDTLAELFVDKLNKSKAFILSVDIPSGLFLEDNSTNGKAIIQASHVLSLELPKLSMLLPENAKYCPGFTIIPIGLDQHFIEKCASKNQYVLPEDLFENIKSRSKFSHKGTFGHALLMAGSYGKIGASILSSEACLRSGAGLLTVSIPSCGYTAMQTAVPEAMVADKNFENYLTEFPDLSPYNAIGIGPGIGTAEDTQKMLKKLIQESKLPILFDADAINILSENKTWLSFIPAGCVFTPHPGEFERLVGKSISNFERLEKLREFAFKYQAYVVLKGAHSVTAFPDGRLFFNSSGNAGMATAGSGDVLTGIILGLLAQGYNPGIACILSVFIHGLAGDFAADTMSEESLIAGDIIRHLPDAFRFLHDRRLKY